jgi:hypothetical protein
VGGRVGNGILVDNSEHYISFEMGSSVFVMQDRTAAKGAQLEASKETIFSFCCSRKTSK